MKPMVNMAPSVQVIALTTTANLKNPHHGQAPVNFHGLLKTVEF